MIACLRAVPNGVCRPIRHTVFRPSLAISPTASHAFQKAPTNVENNFRGHASTLRPPMATLTVTDDYLRDVRANFSIVMIDNL